MEDWLQATNEQLADAAGEAMVETALMFRTAVNQRDWQRAESLAQTIALMGVQCADAAELMWEEEGR
jgi:hypothetical protein